jgi:hypothetical protein
VSLRQEKSVSFTSQVKEFIMRDRRATNPTSSLQATESSVLVLQGIESYLRQLKDHVQQETAEYVDKQWEQLDQRSREELEDKAAQSSDKKDKPLSN